MRKFYALEICRFLCSVAVILWHYQHFFVVGLWTEADAPRTRIGFPLYSIFSLAYNHGLFAVQIFWAISGYVFFWKYADDIHTGKMDGGQFFVLRLSRLYPLHVVTLTVVAVLQALYVNIHGVPFIYGWNTPANFLAQLGMASNWLSSQPFTFNGPIWSVSAEVLAYVVFFLAAHTLRFSPLGSLLATVVLLSLLAILPNQPVIWCLTFFFAGGFVYLSMSRLKRRHDGLIYVVAALLLITFMSAPHNKGVVPTVSAVIVCCLILRFFAAIDQLAPLDLSRVGWAGNLTYACYLIHFPLQITFAMIVDSLGVGRAVFLSPVMLLAYLSATLAGAAVVYIGFELPAQNLIRRVWRWRRRREQVSA